MYKILEVRDAGELLGYVIAKPGLIKLDSINIYKTDELDEITKTVEDLNEAAEIRQYWPMPNDPEVDELLANSHFEPLEYEDVTVPDYENSEIHYLMKPGPKVVQGDQVTFGPDEIKYDETGQPEIDWIKSQIVYKTERQAVRVNGKARIDAACEQVARRRAAQAQG